MEAPNHGADSVSICSEGVEGSPNDCLGSVDCDLLVPLASFHGYLN